MRGLDEILNGGFPSGSLTLVNGGPGSGKTLLGLEFLYRGALEGHPGVLLTFEERVDTVRRNVRTLGWELGPLEEEGRLALIEARIDQRAMLAGDFDLHALLAILEQQADRIGAKRVIFDGPDVFLRLLGDPVKERAEFYRVNEWLRDRAMTTLMTVKRPTVEDSRYEFLDYLSDCVIELDQRVTDQIATRRLRVVKFRGSDCGRNEYPFSIYQSGLHIIPVTATGLRHRALGEALSSGVEELDTVLGGGLRRGSCNLISGTSGTGKTTLACSFVRSSCRQGDTVLYIDFEESQETLFEGMLSPGIDLQPHLESGRFRFHSIMPEAMGVEEHLVRAFHLVEECRPASLVVDAISAARRMGSAQAAFDFLLRLIDFCKERAVTTVLTNLASGRHQDTEITGVDLSSVIDTVILLRNVERDEELQRELLVLKSRGRAHSSLCHRFWITDDGIRIDGTAGSGRDRG